jgi:hypothetical protein
MGLGFGGSNSELSALLTRNSTTVDYDHLQFRNDNKMSDDRLPVSFHLACPMKSSLSHRNAVFFWIDGKYFAGSSWVSNFGPKSSDCNGN